MRDPRLDKLADVLVNYSTGIEPGWLVRISGEPVATPLVEAIYEAVVKAGAHPMVRLAPESLANTFFKHASDAQLDYVNPVTKFEMQSIDASIGLWADVNTKAMSNVDPRKQGRVSAARKPIMDIFMNRAAKGELKWSGTQFPTQASAQDAEMSLEEYADFVFKAGHLDQDDPAAEWRKISEAQQKVVDYLTGKKELRFQTPSTSGGGTDLTVNIEGMTWINCDGHENFPDGEVFTGPNLNAPDGGVNGVVHYSFPAVHHGREVHDIVLTFEKGKVVDAKASKNQDFLIAMLDQDEGARRLGEIAIGTNYSITRYTKNTLFDEKIGGTFHAAVGAGYPETGNTNQSGLHWDMVCDLRADTSGGETSGGGTSGGGTSGGGTSGGGTITVDGEVISRDGRFVFDGWPGNA